MPTTTGSTASRCDGLEAMATGMVPPDRPVKTPSAPLWYLTSPEPWTESGSRFPSNSSKISPYDLPTMLASTFSRPRWAMPITAPRRPSPTASSRMVSSSTMADSAPSRPKRFWPDVAGVEEPLEHLGGVQAAEDVPLLVRGQSGRHPLDVLLDPPLLLEVLDVHVLDPEGPAVGVAQDVEDLVERRHVPAGQPVGHELPRQVPDGEAVVRRVELGVELGRLGVERVQVGDEVAPHPVHVDQGLDVDLLDQALVEAVRGVVGGVGVDVPPHRLVGDLHGGEDVVVEAVVPHQALGHVGQEEPGLGPLDDPVVVGRRERDGLADPRGRPGCGRRPPRTRPGTRGPRRRR